MTVLTFPPKLADYPVREDPDDWRDFLYRPVGTPLRDSVDLRVWASPVENQAHLGSCTGNAVVGAYELLLNLHDPLRFTDLSRLFIYYNARLLEGGTDSDVGAYVRDAVKSVHKYGVCSEKIWPYLIDHFAITPSVSSYQDAQTRNIKNYFRLLNLNDILDALNNNRPVVFSMNVYGAFKVMGDGDHTLAMPEKDESPIGGHAMCFVGYDLPNRKLLARNSFGKNWGMGGYCWIPFDYVPLGIMDNWTFDIDLTI